MGWSSSGSPGLYSSERALRHIAEKRGFKDTDELLVSLGKQNTRITLLEAIDLMAKELGPKESIDYCLSIQYSSPRECERLLKNYKESIRSRDRSSSTFNLKLLKKYCGYRPDEEGK